MRWLGWLDSNQRVRESKSLALPLGYTPMQKEEKFMGRTFVRPANYPMGWVKGFEPSASRATIWRANQLRHTHHSGFRRVEPSCFHSSCKGQIHRKKDGTPGGIRTRDLPLRRRLLYPTELQAHMEQVMGIEPTSPAWKAGALAVVLHLQI